MRGKGGMQFEGSVLARGEDGYEDARQTAAWNARKPDRFPEVIVQFAILGTTPTLPDGRTVHDGNALMLMEHMRRLEPPSEGIQLADENLWQRPARYLSDENEARLERLRAQYDPEGRFHSYLTGAGGTE
jgi:hypothetical protein